MQANYDRDRQVSRAMNKPRLIVIDTRNRAPSSLTSGIPAILNANARETTCGRRSELRNFVHAVVRVSYPNTTITRDVKVQLRMCHMRCCKQRCRYAMNISMQHTTASQFFWLVYHLPIDLSNIGTFVFIIYTLFKQTLQQICDIRNR